MIFSNYCSHQVFFKDLEFDWTTVIFIGSVIPFLRSIPPGLQPEKPKQEPSKSSLQIPLTLMLNLHNLCSFPYFQWYTQAIWGSRGQRCRILWRESSYAKLVDFLHVSLHLYGSFYVKVHFKVGFFCASYSITFLLM